MDLKQYIRVLRAHWLIVVLSVLVCTVVAGVIAWTQTPTYTASTQLFVATSGRSTDPSQAYQGGLFAQQRVLSYAQLVSSPRVAQAVIAQLGLPESAQQLESQVSASVPQGTVLIDLTATDRSPQRAKAIVDAVGNQFSRLVSTLEASGRSAQQGTSSPVTVSVTSPARVPTSPVSPRKPLYLVLGLLLGLALGVAAAMLREALDRRLRSEEHAAAVAGAPIFGRIAKDRSVAKRPLIVASDPSSAGADAYRQLRTNLRVLSADLGLRSFAVCSAGAREGKTLVAANLGYAFAQAGHSTVIVDADLRRPRLADVVGLQARVGLSDVLAGDVAVESALHRHSTLPLEVLASGPTPSNPSELLGSEQCVALIDQLTRRAEFVIVDTPAMLPVSDASILAQLVSAVLLVARVPTTRVRQFARAVELLRAVGAPPLGVVMNGMPQPERSPYHKGRPQVAAEEPRYDGVVTPEGMAGSVDSS